MRSRERYSRRAFLKATGVSPLLLPLLEPGLARAGCLANPPRRAVFVIMGNGALPGNGIAGQAWPSPGATESDFILPSGMTQTTKLNDGTVVSLNTFRQDLVFIDKLNYGFLQDTTATDGVAFDGHRAVMGILTCRPYVPSEGNNYEWLLQANGQSLDQHLGIELGKRGFAGIPGLPNGVLYQSVRMLNPVCAVWRAANDRVLPMGEPGRVFSTLFAGAAGGTAGAPDPGLERLRRARKSVLDAVAGDLDRFSRRLGTGDRARIQKHLTSIRSIETGLSQAPPALACPVPMLDASLEGTATDPHGVPLPWEEKDVTADMQIPAVLKLQFDLLVAALATDRTRVAVLQFSDTRDNDWAMPWLGFTTPHHQVAHGMIGNEAKLKADEWLYSQWAYLIGQLKGEMEGNGKSVLDSSVLAFLNMMTVGPTHQAWDVPAFLAGSCGGHFKTGRAILNRAPNQYHVPLLVSMANAIGVPLTSWGYSKYNSGEMPGLRA